MLRDTFDPHQPHNAVSYGRMSTDMQNDRSPDQQFSEIHATVRQLGYPWKILREYRDDGISGKLTKHRPQFQQMLRDVKSRAVPATLILVHTWERFSRADEGDTLRRELAALGILVLTADTNFINPNSQAGRAVSFVEQVRSTSDAHVKAVNVLRGQRDAIRQRKWCGGVPPLGYRLQNVMVIENNVEKIDHRILVIDPLTRWIIELIFRMAAEGLGGTKIAKALNANPDIPDQLKPFRPNRILFTLRNRIYIGEMVWGKQCQGIVRDKVVRQPIPEEEWLHVPDYCEPIVPLEVWDKVQFYLDQRRAKFIEVQRDRSDSSTPKVTRRGLALNYPLSGLVRCSKCSRTMTITGSTPFELKSGEVRRYAKYACTGHRDGLCDNGFRVPEDWLRKTVLDLVRQRLFFEDGSAPPEGCSD